MCTEDPCDPEAADADAFGYRHVPRDQLCLASDDGLACTGKVCQPGSGDPILGCLPVPDDTLCDDDLYCNGDESCSAESGCLDVTW